MPQAKSAATSGRYTAPKPKSEKHSPSWLPVVMGTAFMTGLAIIVLNYLNVLPGPNPENRYLFIGLAWVLVGFAMASNYH